MFEYRPAYGRSDRSSHPPDRKQAAADTARGFGANDGGGEPDPDDGGSTPLAGVGGDDGKHEQLAVTECDKRKDDEQLRAMWRSIRSALGPGRFNRLKRNDRRLSPISKQVGLYG